MSAQECWDAADECGAPMVAIPGGEPLIHKEIGEIVRGLVARKKFVSLVHQRIAAGKEARSVRAVAPICSSRSISTA